MRWKNSYPSTRRWLDRGNPRDAGEWYACQRAMNREPSDLGSSRYLCLWRVCDGCTGRFSALFLGYIPALPNGVCGFLSSSCALRLAQRAIHGVGQPAAGFDITKLEISEVVFGFFQVMHIRTFPAKPAFLPGSLPPPLPGLPAWPSP